METWCSPAFYLRRPVFTLSGFGHMIGSHCALRSCEIFINIDLRPVEPYLNSKYFK